MDLAARLFAFCAVTGIGIAKLADPEVKNYKRKTEPMKSEGISEWHKTQ